MRTARLARGLATLLAASLAVGCGLFELPGSDIVTDETQLPESDPSLQTTEVAPDRVTFTYDHAADAKRFSAGDVLVGGQGGGYLRRVQRAEASGNTLVVHTENAVLTDALANQHVELSITPAATKAAKRTLLDLTGKVLVDTDVGGVPVKITVVRGTAELEPTIDFALDIAKRKLEHLGVTMKGTLTLSLDVQVEVGGTVTLAQEVDLSGPGANLYTYPFVFPLPTPIGPLPVAGTLELEAFAGFVANVTAQGTFTGGFEGTSAFTLGATWDDGAWTLRGEPSFDGMIHTPQVGTVLASELRAYVRPEVRARFYGVAGPRASVTPSLKAAVTVTPPAAPEAKLEGCVKGEVGFDAKLFGVELIDLAHEFPEVCRALPLL
ncbi:MAG: hypothetical protein R3B48_14390 [Kofleriaceae bacterium]